MNENPIETVQELENCLLGKILKKHRENLNIDVKTVADYIKVRSQDIKSLEDNDIEKIARNIYIPGLIKSYAKYLKIDEELINNKIQELSLKSNVDNKKHTLVNIGDDNELSPNKDLVINSLIISILIVFIFLIVFSSLENNVDSINTNNIISDIQKINN